MKAASTTTKPLAHNTLWRRPSAAECERVALLALAGVLVFVGAAMLRLVGPALVNLLFLGVLPDKDWPYGSLIAPLFVSVGAIVAVLTFRRDSHARERAAE